MQSFDPWISSAMAMAMSIYRTLCVLVFVLRDFRRGEVKKKTHFRSRCLFHRISIQNIVFLPQWIKHFRKKMALARSICRTLSLLPIAFDNEHITSEWSPMTTPWPPTDLQEPLIDLPWLSPLTLLWRTVTSHWIPMTFHDFFHFLVFFFFFFFSLKFHS